MDKPEFTKEQLEAIKIVDSLYNLKLDVDKAFQYYLKVRNENVLCIKENQDVNGFSSFLPKLFCDILGMMKNNDLIHKNILEKYMQHVLSQEGSIFTSTLNTSSSDVVFSDIELKILKDIETKNDW